MTKTLWICLLTLAVVMLFCESEANFIRDSPCMKLSSLKQTQFGPIKSCHEQTKKQGFKHHAYLIITDSGKEICLKPNLPWLKGLIQKGELKCTQHLSIIEYEVLDEDDVE